MIYKVPTMCETLENIEKLSNNNNNHAVKALLIEDYKTCK